MTAFELKKLYPLVHHIFFNEPKRENYNSEWAYTGAYLKWKRKYA